MSATAGGVEQAAIQQYCKALRTTTIGTQFAAMAEQAQREEHTYTRYLEALLAMEVEERERNTVARRIQAARFPRMKTLEDFDFSRSKVPANRIRGLADGGYLEHAEPVVLIGECGTGKTHLATGLCVAACRQKKRVRFTTAAGLINELVEAQHNNQFRRVLARWFRYELIAIDEVGYVPMADLGAELLFQVISDRAERATVILTTNLPFSEWTQVFPNVRLCKALLDRITDRAHIIETGTESFRFRRTLEKRQKPRHPAWKGETRERQPRPEGRIVPRSSILGDPGLGVFSRKKEKGPKRKKRRPVEDDALWKS